MWRGYHSWVIYSVITIIMCCYTKTFFDVKYKFYLTNYLLLCSYSRKINHDVSINLNSDGKQRNWTETWITLLKSQRNSLIKSPTVRSTLLDLHDVVLVVHVKGAPGPYQVGYRELSLRLLRRSMTRKKRSKVSLLKVRNQK